MKFEFPDTGEGVTEGQFLDWKVEEGDEVEEDQIVGEAETDKAVVEIPAPADGVVEELKAAPGDKVHVGDVIMILDTGEETAGEQKEDEQRQEKAEEAQEKAEKNETRQKEEKDETRDDSDSGSSDSDVEALPKVRKLAEREGVDLASLGGGRITEEQVKNAADGESEEQDEETETEVDQDIMATPSTRKLARDKGIDLKKIQGTGKGGKITREDVLKAASGERPKKQDRSSAEEMSSLRKTVAERMTESKFTAPHVTHFDTADVTKLVELRENKKESVETHLTYLPFIMKAAQLALKHHPRLNSELVEEEDRIDYKDSYDFNIAVDTERGLLTPIIESVDGKSVVNLADEISEKAGKARDGDIGREEMRNGTFSITNVGAIGGEEFTPIINYPQVAILGVGKIQETAEVVDGEVVPRMTVKLSLSYDHRVVDGAEAARFMNDLIENLEDPDNMLLEI